ncbi:MAG: hypothetical protein EOP38_20830 [Rubrivivax sp.]|nr:MAG: hypothetical protein EOP38_20830 [Rubrivivax sp.]
MAYRRRRHHAHAALSRLPAMTDQPPSPPRLHQNSQTLSLSFESSLIQSCMRLDAPDELVLDYTRAMMAFLLVNPAPKSILMIGLGGGSMLKYLHRHLPDADITTIEIHQGVIDLRQDFHIPPDDERLRILCADGAQFVANAPHRYDVILVDGFDGSGLPAALCSRGFYQHCRQALTPQGLLVANVQADTEEEQQIAKRLAKVFDDGLALVASDEGGNLVAVAGDKDVLAQCALTFNARWDQLAPTHQATLAASSTRLERALLKIRRSSVQTTVGAPPHPVTTATSEGISIPTLVKEVSSTARMAPVQNMNPATVDLSEGASSVGKATTSAPPRPKPTHEMANPAHTYQGAEHMSEINCARGQIRVPMTVSSMIAKNGASGSVAMPKK